MIELIDDTRQCYVCGAENPLGLRVHFERLGENGSRASYTARAEHAGWPGILHGGVTFALMDEALGWALYFRRLRGVTAKTETRFRAPIKVGTPLVVSAVIQEFAGRLARAAAEIRRDDGSQEKLADLTATMYLVSKQPGG